MFVSRRILVGAMLTLLICAGCGQQGSGGDDPVVINMKGNQVTLSELKGEFNKHWGNRALSSHSKEEVEATDFWATADSLMRAQYLQTTAQKELIVTYMKEKTGGKFTGRDEIIYRRWWEKRVTHFMWAKATELIGETPPALIDSLSEIRADERKLTQIVCRFEEDAREIFEKIQNGSDYDQIGQEYADRNPETTHYVPSEWVFQARIVPEIFEHLYSESEINTIFPPFESQRFGWHIIRLDGARRVDVTPTVDGEPNKILLGVEQQARKIYEMKKNTERFERIMNDLDYEVIPDHLSVLSRRVTAMWDSLAQDRANDIMNDIQALSPPTHRFTPDELELPLVKAFGRTITIGEYINSLHDVDMDYWPTPGEDRVIMDKLERRFKRLAMHEEAKRIGCAEDDDFLTEKKKKIEKLYLDMFERTHIDKYGADLDETDLSDYWNRRKETYLSSDLVGYGYLLFPPMDEDIARRTYEGLRGSSDWGLGPTEARKTDPNIEFVAELDPGYGPEELTEIALNYSTDENGLAVITEPIKFGEQWVILRIHHRSKPHTLTFESAKSFVEHDMKRDAMEDSLIAKLDLLTDQFEMEIFYDRIND